MKIKIIYESDILLPNEILKAFEELHKDIRENKYEEDKVYLCIERLKRKFIYWIDENRKKVGR
jgi:hypothetical protein